MGPRQRWGGLRGALLGAVAAIACMDVVGAAVAETRMGHATAAYRRALQRRAQAGKTSLVEVEATVREPREDPAALRGSPRGPPRRFVPHSGRNRRSDADSLRCARAQAEGGGSPAMMKGGSCLGAKDKCACQVPGESSDCEVIESTCANVRWSRGPGVPVSFPGSSPAAAPLRASSPAPVPPAVPHDDLLVPHRGRRRLRHGGTGPHCVGTAAAGPGIDPALQSHAARPQALCGEIVAQACVDFECCTAEDPTLVDWVENKVYQDSFPDMAVRWQPRLSPAERR